MVYEITNFHGTNNYPTFTNALFGAAKLTKNADIDRYKYFGYGIRFNSHGFYSHPSSGTGRNLIVFVVDMSSSRKIDNRGKDILIRGKGPTQGLSEHSLSAENMYSINFSKENTKVCLNLHCNGANSYLFVNDTEIHITKIHKFTAKDSEIVPSDLCFGNVSKDISANKMKKTGFNGYIYDFSVDYNSIDVNHIKDIHKYLIKK